MIIDHRSLKKTSIRNATYCPLKGSRTGRRYLDLGTYKTFVQKKHCFSLAQTGYQTFLAWLQAGAYRLLLWKSPDRLPSSRWSTGQQHPHPLGVYQNCRMSSSTCLIRVCIFKRFLGYFIHINFEKFIQSIPIVKSSLPLLFLLQAQGSGVWKQPHQGAGRVPGNLTWSSS